jgi:large subunit ribosomal protein L5
MSEEQEKKPKAEKPRAEKTKGEKPKKEKGQAEKGSTEKKPAEPHKVPRMMVFYKNEALPSLMKKFSFTNPMEVPRLTKMVLNMGVGSATQDPKLLDDAVETLRVIAGQQPVVTRAKKAISNFKLRKGQGIGCMVTLRGNMMYEFFDRLVNIALPRVRDFRGVSPKSFDGKGNYAMGIKEQICFHEINSDRISRIMGLNIVVNTNAGNDELAMALLQEMGMPFRKTVGV